MKKKQQKLVPIESFKKLTIYYDAANQQVLFEKDKIFFVIKKNEIFPVLKGLIWILQKFY